MRQSKVEDGFLGSGRRESERNDRDSSADVGESPILETSDCPYSQHCYQKNEDKFLSLFRILWPA